MRLRLRSIIVSLLPLLVPLAVHAQLQNPLGTSDLRVAIGQIIKAMLGLAGVAALAMFVWGGFQWILSRGNEDMIKKGKNTLVWTTIGLVIIFTAYTLVSTLISALSGGTV